MTYVTVLSKMWNLSLKQFKKKFIVDKTVIFSYLAINLVINLVI